MFLSKPGVEEALSKVINAQEIAEIIAKNLKVEGGLNSIEFNHFSKEITGAIYETLDDIIYSRQEVNE